MHWLSSTLSYESLYLQREDVLGFSRFKEAVNSANKARYTDSNLILVTIYLRTIGQATKGFFSMASHLTGADSAHF